MRRWGLSIVLFVVAGAASWLPLYLAALAIAPNRDAEGHVFMPIGQVAFALLAAPVVGGLVAWRWGKREL